MKADPSMLADWFGESAGAPRPLDPRPPFLWPETRSLSGAAAYADMPPFLSFVEDADLLSGVLVDTEDGTIRWLDGQPLQTHVTLGPVRVTRPVQT